MKTALTIILTAIICISGSFYVIQHKTIKPKVITTVKIIKGDSIPYPVLVNVPVIKETVKHDTCWKNKPVDTLAILSQYFAVNYYNDTIRDTSFTAILKEAVTQNTIIGRKLWVQNLREKAIINQTTIINSAPKYWIGTSISFDKISLDALYLKNKNMFGTGYDFFNKKVEVKLYHSF